jgi:hypothetical protein
MAVANLKNLLGAGGSSIVLKAGQSFSTQYGIGGVSTGSLNVSAPTQVIALTGRWALTFVQVLCSNPSVGTMTATLNVDGVNVIGAASVGTGQAIPIHGMQVNSVANSLSSAQSPVIICNTSITLTLQRSTADTVSVQYCALAIE